MHRIQVKLFETQHEFSREKLEEVVKILNENEQNAKEFYDRICGTEVQQQLYLLTAKTLTADDREFLEKAKVKFIDCATLLDWPKDPKPQERSQHEQLTTNPPQGIIESIALNVMNLHIT